MLHKFISVLLILVSALVVNGQNRTYDVPWNTPTFSHSITNYTYRTFGKVDVYDRSHGYNKETMPAIPGLQIRSCSVLCQRDTCFANRAVLAVRCPKEKGLLNWTSGRVALFADHCRGRNMENQASPDEYSYRTSSADIVNYYIGQVKEYFGHYGCNEEDHGMPNEQYGFLLTDCWRTSRYCTFYESEWYDFLSCGNNTTESFYSVDLKTGKAATITDLVKENRLEQLESLMYDHLVNGNGELWKDYANVEQFKPLSILNTMDGCAFIREGLIIYFHPYKIAVGAEGQLNAVIPYDKLKGILKEGLL